MVVEPLTPAAAAYVVSIVVAAGITGVLATVAWRRRAIRGATSLAVIMAGATAWNACSAIQLVVSVEPVIVGLQALKLGAVTVTVSGLFSLSLELSNREHHLDRRTAALLAVEPTAIVLLTATNAWHGLVWGSVAPASSAFNAVQADAAIGFWTHTIYAYAILAVGIVVVALEVLRSRSIYRRQSAAVLIGALLPVVANLLMLTGALEIDLQPIAFAATGIVIAWSIRRYRLIDLVPIARDQVVDTLPDPVIVLDAQDRITDLNDAGIALLGDPEDNPVGTDFAVAFDDYEVVVDAFEGVVQAKQVVRLQVGDAVRVYEIRVTPLEDQRGTEHGRVLVFHDVTEREASRRELEHQNEQLERFASVVSHDLRNPLSVAEGYLPMARETGEDEHFEAIEDSLERMNTIIEDVLTLAREGSRIENRSSLSVRSATRTAWEQVETDGAELRLEDDVTISADENRLQRLFENLFRNAVEHAGDADSDGSGHLTVTVGPIAPDSADSVRGPEAFGFYVEDDGVGIPEERQGEIFEPGHSSSTGGTGLGLSIVNGIAKAHGWSVRATTAENGGARFEFTGAPPIGHPAAITESPDIGAQR